MSELFTQGHACVIGVGGDLPNTVDDAIGLAKILNDSERCAYPEGQVRLLTKEQAKRENILATLDQLAQSTTPDSTVIVYFSGHGYQVAGPMGEAYYLMPFGYDQTKLYKTAISGTEFTAKLQAIPAKKLLVLLDCCHAGGLGDTKNLGYEALYAREVVPGRTGDRQHPILNFEQADNFILAYYAGGETEPKGLPFEGEPEIESEPGEFNRQNIQHTEIVASGDRAVAVQNAQGANIITGDGNIVGSGNI